jgi:hypothetical protein
LLVLLVQFVFQAYLVFELLFVVRNILASSIEGEEKSEPNCSKGTQYLKLTRLLSGTKWRLNGSRMGRIAYDAVSPASEPRSRATDTGSLQGEPKQTDASEYASLAATFRQGLGDAGFVEGRNVLIEYRWAEGHYERLRH